jgi:hypothetical protein
LSARAAARLDTLGFPSVFRYVGGRRDWFAAGLPMQGTRARRPLAGALARRDVPTCALSDAPSEVRARLRASRSAGCVVVDEAGVVLGRVGRAAWRSGDPAAPVEEVMDVPTTYRPDNLVESLIAAGGKANGEVVITTSDGLLIGVLDLREARQRLAAMRPARGRAARARPGRRPGPAGSRGRARTRP